MYEVTSHEASRKFGELIARAKDEPVIITRYGRTAAVLVSGSQYRFYNELLKQATRREMFNAVSAAEAACAADERTAVRALHKLLRPFRR
ncbi:type II toxin-antitoxin system Phd/YefM family antitoxin [Hyphococcus sp.]|uniref:type II toxin-antitoxin system Phd/YefM family antitoxin n=1 Tax=Hyphococcus sp. TaxID=2038636 RepID=UPI003D0BA711